MMRGAKNNEASYGTYKVLKDWPWTHAGYSFSLEGDIDEIEVIAIDPYGRMADTDPINNLWPKPIIKEGK